MSRRPSSFVTASLFALAFGAVALSGCDLLKKKEPVEDEPVSAHTDTAAPPATTPAPDAGTPPPTYPAADAGTPPPADAGPTDAGAPPPADAGPTDAGPKDAGTPPKDGGAPTGPRLPFPVPPGLPTTLPPLPKVPVPR